MDFLAKVIAIMSFIIGLPAFVLGVYTECMITCFSWGREIAEYYLDLLKENK